MSDEKIRKKIESLLKLAGNNPSEEEARSALLKAQDLMLKYHIELDGEDESEPIITVSYQMTGEENRSFVRKSIISLAMLIAENFRTHTFKGAQSICFVGYEADAEASLALIRFLSEELRKGNILYIQEKIMECADFASGRSEYEMNRIRKDWCNGFVDGIRTAFADRKSDGRYEIMLMTPAAVEAVVSQMNLRSCDINERIRRNRDEDAYHRGKKDGEAAIGKRSLENTKIGGHCETLFE